MTFDSRRALFRNYLLRAGVIDALSGALKALNNEKKKPDNIIYYIRGRLCETCPDDGKYDRMAIEKDKLGVLSLELEKELEVLQTREKSPAEVKDLCTKGLKQLLDDTEFTESLLRKYLNESMIEEYMAVRTAEPIKATLYDVCQFGFKRHDVPVNCTAPDAESFNTFGILLEPVIKDAYGLPENTMAIQPYSNWGSQGLIGNVDPQQKYVLSAYVMVSRNIVGYPFATKMTEEQFNRIEHEVLRATDYFNAEHKGRYYKISDISENDKIPMAKRGLFFEQDNERLKSSNVYRLWPTGRGVYSNLAENFSVQINCIDHLRIKSYAKNGDLGDIYSRLIVGVQVMETALSLEHHDSYGYLSPDLMNLGTALNGVVVMALPKLIENQESLIKKVKEDTGCEIKEIDKEKGICEVHLAPSLQQTEIFRMKLLYNCCEYLIKSEKAGELLPYVALLAETEQPEYDEQAEDLGNADIVEEEEEEEE